MFKCICQQNQIILKRQFANLKNVETQICTNTIQRNMDTSNCPSSGCSEFMTFMRDIHGVNFDTITWGYFEREDFVLGPKQTGEEILTSQYYARIATNSEGIDKNTCIVKSSEKSQNFDLDVNFMSKSSCRYNKWNVYMCKTCFVWMFAHDEVENRFAVVMNNKVQKKVAGKTGETRM